MALGLLQDKITYVLSLREGIGSYSRLIVLLEL
jgi:hypothetical protein